MQGDRLSGLDASFLHLEDGSAHMHVASVIVFEGEAPDYVELLEHVERRLHLVPRFRQRLAFVPLGQGRPRWVDDPHLNLRYHLRHSGLPAPGSEQQLRELAGRVFAQPLDRDKPLWELSLVDGLEGDRFALLSKTHHALVDGISGVDIVTVLFDTQPEPAVPAAPAPAGCRGRCRRRPSCSARRSSSGRRSPPRPPARYAPSCARRGGSPARLSTPPPASARWPGPGSARLPPAPTTAGSARTAASAGCGRTSTTSRRSRTSSAGPSTTSC